MRRILRVSAYAKRLFLRETLQNAAHESCDIRGSEFQLAGENFGGDIAKQRAQRLFQRFGDARAKEAHLAQQFALFARVRLVPLLRLFVKGDLRCCIRFALVLRAQLRGKANEVVRRLQ